MSKLSAEDKLALARQACEADLSVFIRTVAPHRELGHVHEELITWWEREERKSHQLVLLPRAHQKSIMVAYRTAWYLTKRPWSQIMYVSASSALATSQLKVVKDILESPQYRRLWPEMTNPEVGKRAKWTEDEIIVDHPAYKQHGSRDPSVKAVGLTSTITGFHADLIVLDDLVEPNNAYTADGRTKVKARYSQLASIGNPSTPRWVVGTRYHPDDLYAHMLDMKASEYDEDGELVREFSVYEIFQRVVETEGEYIWPRQRRKDGEWFGFNAGVLAIVKAEYLDKTAFYSQYYNDPNDPENQQLDREAFQYYDREKVKYTRGAWHVGNTKLNIVCGMDFAYTESKKSDWTTIAIVGMDAEGYYYILDLDRFKTNRISEYFKHLLPLYNKWEFRKLRLETTAAQAMIARDLKENYIQRQGMAISVDEFKPTRHDGKKEERHQATLYPRYDNKQVYHYRGGNCQLLEEELIAVKSPHDDLMDAVTACIDILKPPMKGSARRTKTNVVYNARFGGVACR